MRHANDWRKSGAVLAALVLGTCGAQAVSWIGGGGNSSWFNPANWDPAGVPGAGAAVTNTAGAILLTNETAVLASFTMTGGSVTFSNWTTRLRATEVDLRAGTLTLPPAYANNQMSNRVWVVGTNFTLGTNAVIQASGKGYKAANGPGAGSLKLGASHGGIGGRGDPIAQPQPYDSVSQPLYPGSGGSLDVANYGAGGGAVRIEAGGTATLFGQILADGQDGYRYTGGGAGGSVYISCATLAGSASGLISASGGLVPDWGGPNDRLAGGGGGGRIAVAYSSLSGRPAIRFRGTAGLGGANNTTIGLRHRAGQGTLHLPDTRLLSATLTAQQFQNVDITFATATSWNIDSLTISACAPTFVGPNFILTVTNGCRIDSGGTLGLQGRLYTLGGNVTLTNGGVLRLFSAATNGIAPNYGALVSVTGDLRVANGSWIYPTAEKSNGGTVLFEAQNIRIAAGGGINADGGGFASQMGTGKGNGLSGAGYGGRGGHYDVNVGGTPYGQNNAAMLPGSGGGSTLQGGYGGGCVRLVASGTVTLDGTISADGLRTYSSAGGGGSGGGIDIRCAVFGGAATGRLQARGGAGVYWADSQWYGGGGGGGRIAVDYDALAPGFGVRFDTSHPDGWHTKDPVNRRPFMPAAGTLWFPDRALLSETLTAPRFTAVNLFVDGMSGWTVASLAIEQNTFTFGQSGFTLTVTNDLRIGAGGGLGVRGDVTVTAGDLRLESGGALTVYSAATNGLGRAFGALVDVSDELAVGAGSWIHPIAHETDGGAVLFRAGQLNVATNGGFDADGRGFKRSVGPGKGTDKGGGGHGGRGGNAVMGGAGGIAYGVAAAPTLSGSGGGSTLGGSGGGLIWIEVDGTASVNGILRATGLTSGNTGSGGGAGGGILLAANRLAAGPTAQLSAVGGNAIKHPASADPDKWYTAGGGGGRIALWLQVSEAARAQLIAGQTVKGIAVGVTPFAGFTVTPSVLGGEGYADGNPGTVRYVDGRPRGTVMLVR